MVAIQESGVPTADAPVDPTGPADGMFRDVCTYRT